MSMDWKDVRKGLLQVYDMAPTILGIAMGLILIVRGGWGLVHLFYFNDITMIEGVAFTIMLLAGILVTVMRRIDLIRTIGLYALTLGLTRVMLRYVQLSADPSLYSILIYLPMLILAFNLMYTGSSFMRGLVIRRMSMMITTFLLTAVNLVIIMLALTFEIDIEALTGSDYLSRFIEIVMYLILIVLLDSEQIRYGTADGKHIRLLSRIRSSYRIEKDSHITPVTAECLIKRDGPMWKEVNDGTVEKEMSFKVYGRTMDAVIIAQIWKGHDQLYLSVVQAEGTIVYANRMKIDVIEGDEKTIHFYGRDGSDFEFGIESGVAA